MNVPASPTLALAHGAAMPQLGLGTWPMPSAEAERAVAIAADAGYRLFDTAYAYGNEEGVGRGLRASGVPREELFVTTKVNGEWHGRRAVQDAWEMAARKLAVDYIDLVLIHWPMPWQDRYVDAFRGLGRLLEQGRVRAIGGSNFKPAHLERVLAEAGVTPDVNQIQLSPYTQRREVRAYHEQHGVVTQSWSPIALGRELLAEPVIADIAGHHGRTPAQVVLRWHVQLGLAAVPKSSNPKRIAENIALFDWALEPTEVAAISGLERGESHADDSDSIGH